MMTSNLSNQVNKAIFYSKGHLLIQLSNHYLNQDNGEGQHHASDTAKQDSASEIVLFMTVSMREDLFRVQITIETVYYGGSLSKRRLYTTVMITNDYLNKFALGL